MQKITINNANIRINKDSIIFDNGDLTYVTIFIEENVSLKYCFVPQSPGEFHRLFEIEAGAKLVANSVVVVENMNLEMIAHSA